jgi:hypothetical protein
VNPLVMAFTVAYAAPCALLVERARKNRAEARGVLFVQSLSPELCPKEIELALCLTVEAAQFDPQVPRG